VYDASAVGKETRWVTRWEKELGGRWSLEPRVCLLGKRYQRDASILAPSGPNPAFTGPAWSVAGFGRAFGCGVGRECCSPERARWVAARAS
jgi:hypothetical protein